MTESSTQVPVVKTDDERRLVFGWASVAIDKSGEVVTDLHNDLIDSDTLEEAAYYFNLDFREANEMHAGPSVGRLVESMVFTDDKIAKLAGNESDPDYAANLAALQKALPRGWWVGFYLEDEAAFAKVKDGTYKMFSIEGVAHREELNV